MATPNLIGALNLQELMEFKEMLLMWIDRHGRSSLKTSLLILPTRMALFHGALSDVNNHLAKITAEGPPPERP